MSELVIFRSNGVDSHGAYHKGVPSELLKFLNKLGVGKNTIDGGVYTVPIAGFYRLESSNPFTFAFSSHWQNYNVGDVIAVHLGDGSNVSIYRLMP